MQTRRTTEILVGLVAFLGVLALAAYVVIRVLSFGTPSAIVTAAFTVGGALIVQAVANAFQRRREIEADQRKEKAKVYESYVDLWFDDMMLPSILAKAESAQEDQVSEDLIRKMGAFTKKVILWGSDDVVREYSGYRRMMTNQVGGSLKPLDPKLAGLEKLFYAFRRDLGYRNRGLGERDLLVLFINDLLEPAISEGPASRVEGKRPSSSSDGGGREVSGANRRRNQTKS